tara:strand:- start:10956 stop:12125 length:1170 start_codon:yes stop_codon:yes gene_type:complete
MGTDTNKHYQIAKYMKNFECIGKDCIDSCCIGWNIEIDKNTYKKYQSSSNKDIRNLSEKYLIKKNENSEINYGKLENLNNSCPFLNQDKLCKAYNLLGKESLSIGCSTYPRIIKNFDNENFIACEMSCPEMARLCLNNKNLKVEKLDKDNLVNIFNSRNIHTFNILKRISDKESQFIEKVLIELKRTNSFFKTLCKIIELHIKLFGGNAMLKDQLKSVNEKIKVEDQLIKIKVLATICFSDTSTNSRYDRLCKQAKEQSEFLYKSEIEFKERFLFVYKNKFKRFAKENDLIFKNFFMNEFLKNIEKIQLSKTSFYDLIREILCLLELSNFLLICSLFGNKKKLNIDDFVNVISAVTKKVQSSKEKTKLLIEFFRKIDNDNLYKRLIDFI